MKNLSILIILFLTIQFSYAQTVKPVAEAVSTYRSSGIQFTPVNLFENIKTNIDERSAIKTTVSNATFFDINTKNITALRSSNETAINLNIPISKDEEVELELVQVDIFTPDFEIETSEGLKTYEKKGVHYRGIIKGQSNSLASISVFENEVAGFFANDKGNYVLGKLEDAKTEHILYLESDLSEHPIMDCGAEDHAVQYTKEELAPLPEDRAVGDCVRIFIEVDQDVHDDKGADTQNHIEAIFAQSATLYANEQLEIGISKIYIWTVNSPYVGNSSAELLNEFQARYSNANPFNGDLGHFVSYKAPETGLAHVNVICNPSIENRTCFSSITTNVETVPTYTFSVFVFSHEMGHLFGSLHTHDCAWNGNGTAIDGCKGSTDGNCADPGFPAGGGTIMSYCHFDDRPGVNFNLGFGPQPGNVIRNSVANAACLSATCEATCNENPVSLTITLDNYPGETTWSITSGGTTHASGNTNGTAANTIIVVKECLANGCYDFTINDSYGDGICCASGIGSYVLTDENGTVLATGGEFTNTETTNFCIGASCTDGIQNGDETGVDCGGSSCAPCPCELINFNDYTIESFDSPAQPDGPHAVWSGGTWFFIYNNTWKMIDLNYNVTAGTVIEFDFYSSVEGEVHGLGFENATGNTSSLYYRFFMLSGTQNWGIQPYNDYTTGQGWKHYVIPVGQFYTGNFNRLVFGADHDASPMNGNSLFANVKVYDAAPCNSARMTDPSTTDVSVLIDDINKNDVKFETAATTATAKSKIYPNPATTVINVDLAQSSAEAAQISIIDMYGKVVRQQTAINEYTVELEIADLTPGLYLVKVENGDETTVEKVVVK